MKAVFLDFATVSHDDVDLTRLRVLLPDLTLYADTARDELGARVTGAEIVLNNKVQLNADTIAACADLKLIAMAATGTNNVDLDAARAQGVAVCNVRAYCTQSVVQHVIGALLALTHHFADYQRRLREGAWSAASQFCLLDFPIRELSGRTLGIVGYGELGRAVARAAESLGMRILISNRPGGEREEGRYDLDTLLPVIDVLSLHCPLTPATRGLIGARELSLMKRNAILINTARGALVDTAALADALRAYRLGGAGIDVLPQEPPVAGDPLLFPDIPNLLLTPHIAWAAREARQRAVDQMTENIESFLGGGRLRRVV